MKGQRHGTCFEQGCARTGGITRRWTRRFIDDAAALTAEDMARLSRPGFQVVFYDTLEDFYLAEALEYITAWKQSTADNPVGICGPIGPTEQLPLVARLVNALELDLRSAHFWGMDEWVDQQGVPVPIDHPLSFAKADLEMCFNRIDPKLRMPEANLHFPTGDLAAYSRTYDQVRCAVMQGGQGDVKHWAFNDPPKREGAYRDAPPSPDRVPETGHSGDRAAPDDDHPERADLGRGPHRDGADPRGDGRAGRDVEGREGLDLAGRHARQPLRHAAHHADDRQAAARRRRADVAAGGPSQRAVQFLPSGNRHRRGCGRCDLSRADRRVPCS